MKVPEPRKLKSGNWFIQLRLSGESIPVTAATKAECKQQASLIKAEHLAGKRTPVSRDALTLTQAIDSYIESKTNTLSPSTIRSYRSMQKTRFTAYLNKPLSGIPWQKLINEEAAEKAAKTVKNEWRFLRSVIVEAGLTPPRVQLPQVVQQTRPWLDPEQIRTFIDAITPTPYAIPALLALHSLRRSEILALTWENVDLKKNTIRVSGAAVFDENENLVQKATNKNASSARTLPIMIPQLQEALAAVPEKKGLVVPCSPDVMRRAVNRICLSSGLPTVGMHGLRHSFASLAYHLGLSEQQTMEMGGWSDTQTMRKIYTHIGQADRLKAENKMAEFYKK